MGAPTNWKIAWSTVLNLFLLKSGLSPVNTEYTGICQYRVHGSTHVYSIGSTHVGTHVQADTNVRLKWLKDWKLALGTIYLNQGWGSTSTWVLKASFYIRVSGPNSENQCTKWQACFLACLDGMHVDTRTYIFEHGLYTCHFSQIRLGKK